MDNTVTNVSAGKPNISGAVYRAALGSTIPTDATTALAAAYKCMGYVSEDGMTNSNTLSSTDIKAWGGDIVLSIQDEKNDKFQFKLLEVLNPDVLKAVHGAANVTGSLSTGITVDVNSTEQEEAIWVFELAMRDSAIKRIVVPDAKITEIGDVVYSDSDAVAYDITLTAYPDSSGDTHHEYIIRTGSI